MLRYLSYVSESCLWLLFADVVRCSPRISPQLDDLICNAAASSELETLRKTTVLAPIFTSLFPFASADVLCVN